MRKIPNEFRAELANEIAEKSVISAKVGCGMILFLYPLFGILDWVLYPEVAWELITARIVVTVIEIINFFVITRLQKLGKAKDWIRPMSWAIIYPAAIGLNFIVLAAGGAESPYYAGLNLLLLGVMVALPWPPLEMGANIFAIWFLYLLTMLFLGPELDNWRIFLGNNYFMISSILIGMVMNIIGYQLRVQEFMARKELAQEKKRSDDLLLNILPKKVADELKTKGHVEAVLSPSATILFTDFVGFTSIADKVSPADLVQSLHQLFTAFDEIITRHGLEKLKTIGDAYMCVGGLPVERPNHLIASILASLEIQDFLERYQASVPNRKGRWQARIGVHTGPVIAGVIGNIKFAYDVWGDTVNLASRLEAASKPGRINVSSDVFRSLKPYFQGEDRGYLPVKGKGPLAMTFIRRLKPDYSADSRGYYPNKQFWDIIKQVNVDPSPSTLIKPAHIPMSLPDLPDTSRSSSMQPNLWKQLNSLTDQDRLNLTKIVDAFGFEIDDELVAQGQRVDALLVVVKGHVSVRIEQEDTSLDVSILGPGDLFGEMSFVTGEVASAAVIGTESGQVARISKEELQKIMTEDVSFASRLYQSLAALMAKRLKETTTRLPALMVEEVAHTKLHHSTITGRIGMDALPPFVIQGVDDFKQGMWALDRELLKVGKAEELHYEKASQLCVDLKATLSKGISAVADKGQDIQDGLGTYVFRETFPYFMLSGMIDRSFSKPRGYAGDYYTIELIQLNEARGDSRLGPLIDRHYLESPPSLAVRNRRAFMSAALLTEYQKSAGPEQSYQITSLAAGAGRELFDFLGNIPANAPVSATCIDIDPQALTYGSHLAQEMGINNRVLFAKENVIYLALGRGHTRLPPQDFIYSMGLFDYLKDKLVIRLLNWIHKTLKPGGVTCIGNFVDTNPEKDFMDHILDWRLYHRSHDDMRRLFAASDFGDQVVDVETESAGVNLMVFCRKATP